MTSFDLLSTSDEQAALHALLAWSASIVGPCEVASGDARFHGRSSVLQLRTERGRAYLKVHGQRSSWGTEVHAYEQWARTFGERTPRLLGVHDEEPLALLISELPGQRMKDVALPPDRERAAWREAGAALAVFHDLPAGECFGPCTRDGRPQEAAIRDAGEYVLAELERWTADGVRAGSITDDELLVIDAAKALAPAFVGERPVACHRDYNPYNWLVSADGAWAGVIDFEFCYPDVRVAEFTRYPEWEWLLRPDLVAALLEGYGRALTPLEERQCLFEHVNYAVGMIVWGCQHEYFGSAAEGREALDHLASRLR